MPEWLTDSFPGSADLSLPVVALRLVAALVLGCVVAGIYRMTHGKSSGEPLGLMATLVMLTVLIALVTLVINDKVARAFSLVGALAIVRFRTTVEDTRDTAFVIFAVAVGMGMGVGAMTVTLAGIPVAAASAFLFRRQPAEEAARDFALTVRIGPSQNPDVLLRNTFAKHLDRFRLSATATARQGAALELTYAVRLRRADAAVALVVELNGLDGMQGVELRLEA